MDLSTIGVKFGWAVEETAGTKPKAFTWIKRCSKIAGINVTKDKIDVSCFEDKIKQYIAVLVILVETGILTSTGQEILLRLGMHY